jgi:hypothetical protein
MDSQVRLRATITRSTATGKTVLVQYRVSHNLFAFSRFSSFSSHCRNLHEPAYLLSVKSLVAHEFPWGLGRWGQEGLVRVGLGRWH